jgi:hypothetical protein
MKLLDRTPKVSIIKLSGKDICGERFLNALRQVLTNPIEHLYAEWSYLRVFPARLSRTRRMRNRYDHSPFKELDRWNDETSMAGKE